MFAIMKENLEDLLTPNLWLALLSEFVGTLVITLLGCGSWLDPVSERTFLIELRVALTFGLAVATVVLVFSHISGGHINPAVTAAALFTRRVSIIRGVLYVIVQILGGISGAGILYGLKPSNVYSSLGVNQVQENITSAQGFGAELLATFVYVLTVFACLDAKRTDLKGSAPLTIGLSVVVCHLFAELVSRVVFTVERGIIFLVEFLEILPLYLQIPFTRAGLNPARSFGPAVITSSWADHWVFWVGPVAGAISAGLLYDYVFAAGATFDGVTKCLLRTKKPRPPPEPEKTALEEVKSDVIDIEEAKVDPEKPQDGVEPEAEKEKPEVEAVNDVEKK